MPRLIELQQNDFSAAEKLYRGMDAWSALCYLYITVTSNFAVTCCSYFHCVLDAIMMPGGLYSAYVKQTTADEPIPVEILGDEPRSS